jgi:hypothetical protein
MLSLIQKFQMEQNAARDRDLEIVSRLSNLEEGAARFGHRP